LIFNVSLIEFIFIVLFVFIFIGTDDLVKMAKKMGLWLNKLMRSESWREIQETAEYIRSLPGRIMQETELEETIRKIKADTNKVLTDVNKDMHPGTAPKTQNTTPQETTAACPEIRKEPLTTNPPNKKETIEEASSGEVDKNGSMKAKQTAVKMEKDTIENKKTAPSRRTSHSAAREVVAAPRTPAHKAVAKPASKK